MQPCSGWGGGTEQLEPPGFMRGGVKGGGSPEERRGQQPVSPPHTQLKGDGEAAGIWGGGAQWGF